MGETIVDEGTQSDFFYTIANGRVKVVKRSPARNDVIIALVRATYPLNGDTVYANRPTRAAAIALEPTTCVVVPKRAVRGLLEQYPTAARCLLLGLSETLGDALDRIADLNGPVECRLAQLFLRFAHTVGHTDGATTFIPGRLSRQELADSVGTTIETCIRIMSRWGKSRIVTTKRSGFRVIDHEYLEHLTHIGVAHRPLDASTSHRNGRQSASLAFSTSRDP